MEFENKLSLITSGFGVTASVDKDNGFALINLESIESVSENKYEMTGQLDLTLDYDEIDEIIRVLKYASDELKRGDNEYAGK